jgi:hypothetical protein
MSDSAPPAKGRHRLLAPDGAELESAEASFEVQPDALVVQLAQQAPLRVDFADLDALEMGDHVFSLKLATGETVEASMLGRRFAEISDATAAALAAFQVKNLLLQESVGGEEFACDVAREGKQGPAQLRVFATSLAVLPRAAVPYGLPFGELTGVGFDEDRYAIDLATADGKISLLKLGKQTQPCLHLVEARLAELRTRHSAALAFLAPRLGSIALRRLAQAMPDGVPAHRTELDAISPDAWPALVKGAVAEPKLRASSEALAAHCPAGEAAIGLKETNARQDAEEEEVPLEGEGEPESPPEQSPPEPQEDNPNPMTGRVAWFALPIWSEDRRAPGNAVAVEAVTRTGRATYFFRIAPAEVYAQASPEQLKDLARKRVRTLSRALVALTFKRAPIYLPDATLATGPYARYRLALRLSAPLKAARECFVGRAVHGAGWEKQVGAALEKARG